MKSSGRAGGGDQDDTGSGEQGEEEEFSEGSSDEIMHAKKAQQQALQQLSGAAQAEGQEEDDQSRIINAALNAVPYLLPNTFAYVNYAHQHCTLSSRTGYTTVHLSGTVSMSVEKTPGMCGTTLPVNFAPHTDSLAGHFQADPTNSSRTWSSGPGQ